MNGYKKEYLFNKQDYLKLFDDVMASNKDFNLSSHNKAETLVQLYGERNFDYMGDHLRDLPIWEVSQLSIIVNATNRIIANTFITEDTWHNKISTVALSYFRIAKKKKLVHCCP